MIRTFGIRLTNTSLGTVFLSDVDDGVDLLNSFRKAGPVYIGRGVTVELLYTTSVALSFERGAIRGFIDQGKLTATFIQGSNALGPTQLIYSPNGVDDQGKGVFTNFAELYATFQETPGLIEIYLDFPNGDSGIVPGLPPEFRTFPIPSAAYDFELRATIVGAINSVLAIAVPEAGTTIVRLIGLVGGVGMYNTTPNPVVFVGENAPFSPEVFILRDGGIIASAPGAAPLIEVATGPSGSPQSVLAIDNGSIISTGAPSVRIVPGGFLILALLPNATIQADTIEGDAATVIFALISGASTGVDLMTQSFFLGTLLTMLNQPSNQIEYTPSVLADWSGVSPGNVRDALDRIAAMIGPIP